MQAKALRSQQRDRARWRWHEWRQRKAGPSVQSGSCLPTEICSSVRTILSCGSEDRQALTKTYLSVADLIVSEKLDGVGAVVCWRRVLDRRRVGLGLGVAEPVRATVLEVRRNRSFSLSTSSVRLLKGLRDCPPCKSWTVSQRGLSCTQCLRNSSSNCVLLSRPQPTHMQSPTLPGTPDLRVADRGEACVGVGEEDCYGDLGWRGRGTVRGVEMVRRSNGHVGGLPGGNSSCST
ncbi:hypothetical protein IWX49DRAFT_386245 [Phyllosticta citricarpa]|uniref:Uncharacterized protein n=1 Tax=Phyllosticta paracitricarpa TaxID=2016321 RepID=A0ABR1MRN2_9PEZI